MYTMKALLISLCVIHIISHKFTSLQPNTLFEDSIKNSELKYYTIKTEKENKIAKDMIISSTLTDYDNKSTTPIIEDSTIALPNKDKSTQWMCGKVGREECVIPKTFIKRAEKMYIGVFCEKCSYNLKVTFGQENVAQSQEKQETLRNLMSVPSLRLVQETQTVTPQNSTTTTPSVQAPWKIESISEVRGAGVASLSLGFLFVFTVIISSYIMMSIFVNSKFINQPLKLGKIES